MSSRTNGAALLTALSFESDVAEEQKKRNENQGQRGVWGGGEGKARKENKASQRIKSCFECQLLVG